MSGFLPDIANWALGGGAGQSQANENSEERGRENRLNDDKAEVNDEDIRAKRLARMTDVTSSQPIDQNDNMAIDSTESSPPSHDHEAMDIDEDRKLPAKPSINEKKREATKPPPLAETSSKPPFRAPVDPAKKIQKKKELLLKKTLGISLSHSTMSSDPSLVCLDIETTEVSTSMIAEVLASRLSLSPDSAALQTVPAQKHTGTISYLGSCFRNADEELKNLRQSTGSNIQLNQSLEEILQEIKRQLVSYAASSLLLPDLFELGHDGTAQLAKSLQFSTIDVSSSLTYSATASTKASFYFLLCEEIISQDYDGFVNVIRDTIVQLGKLIENAESLLDNDGLCAKHVSAFTGLISHKKSALVFCQDKAFLLPAKESEKAKERVSTNPSLAAAGGGNTQQQRFFRMMQALSQGRSFGYLRRSGPAIEKETLLGSILKFGLPFDNPSITSNFSNAATKSVQEANRRIDSMRRQLLAYHNSINSFFRSLVTSGPDVRKQLFQFFIDFLLVNEGATAMRPDKSKVCHPTTLINACVVLLKLCEPFLGDEKKMLLIDAKFVSSEKDHGGVFAMTGENSVPRLSENVSTENVVYNPKNAFIPQCFFFTARALHIGLIPSTALHTNLIRQVNHTAYMIRQRNGGSTADLPTDPNLNQILSLQYSHEATILCPEILSEALRFYNTAVASLFLRIGDEELNAMPEHIIDDLCDLLVFVARLAPKVMLGLDFGNVFKAVVKLLSPKYSHAVRNYNLRAKLGDVLYEVFLPSGVSTKIDDEDYLGNSNSVPQSVYSNPLAGGQPYLISDPQSQETLAPSLLLLYGEVEHTGFYDKMSHRSHIASLIKYLWESEEHRPAFRRITQNTASFIKFANGIMNETNSLMASIMEKLPEIRRVQLQLASPSEWAAIPEEQRETISSRHEENEMEVKRALPLCNKTLQMLAFLNTDADIRNLFLLQEMCPRLVNMLLHVMTKLVGSKGLELKVDNPESYHFRPKEMLRDLCLIFAYFASASEFQMECAKSGYYNLALLEKSIKTCRKLNLLPAEQMTLFESLPANITKAARNVEDETALTSDAPEEFLDPLMFTLMKDPVLLPTSNTIIDRATITQHLLNDPHDPFNRKELSVDMIVDATDMKTKIETWLSEKRRKRTL